MKQKDLEHVPEELGEDEVLAVGQESVLPIDISSIVQPKIMTQASYCLSKERMNMLVHIREELQIYLIKKLVGLDNDSLISVPLFLKDYPHYCRNIASFHDAVLELKDNSENHVEFSWTYREDLDPLLRWMFGIEDKRGRKQTFYHDGDRIKRSLSIIDAVDFVEGRTDYVVVYLNRLAIPFLIYTGKGMGYTLLSRDAMLHFKSKYSMRLYEHLEEWANYCTTKVFPISELRYRLRLTAGSYDNNAMIRTKVLDVAKKEINECSESSVVFDYKLEYDPEYGVYDGKGVKKTANVVVFTIRKKRKRTDRDELNYKVLVSVFRELADESVAYRCEKVARYCIDKHLDKKLISKFNYYGNKVNNGKMTREENKNTLLKIVREMTGFDLRSAEHIRNASIRERKLRAGSKKAPRLLGGVVES